MSGLMPVRISDFLPILIILLVKQSSVTSVLTTLPWTNPKNDKSVTVYMGMGQRGASERLQVG